MMSRGFLFAAGGIIMLAVAAPQYLETYLSQPSEAKVTSPAEPVAKAGALATPPSAGTVTLNADKRGHYAAKLKINGKQIEGLIDTGASLVSLNESTARRLGYVLRDSDYKYQTSTANGVKNPSPSLRLRGSSSAISLPATCRQPYQKTAPWTRC